MIKASTLFQITVKVYSNFASLKKTTSNNTSPKTKFVIESLCMTWQKKNHTKAIKNSCLQWRLQQQFHKKLRNKLPEIKNHKQITTKKEAKDIKGRNQLTGGKKIANQSKMEKNILILTCKEKQKLRDQKNCCESRFSAKYLKNS